MTYLEFYQAWLDLVMQNTKFIDVSDIKCFKYSYSIFITFFFVFSFPIFIIYFCNLINYRTRKIKFIYIIFILVHSFIIYGLYTYQKHRINEQNWIPKCSASGIHYIFFDFQDSWTEYPEKDYTFKEFQENMTRIGQKASPEQIELAKTVLKDCFENLLPSDYQVNHSSIVRRYINSPEVKEKFSVKDVEIYRNKTINELTKSN